MLDAHKHGLHAKQILIETVLRIGSSKTNRQGPKLYPKVLTISPFHLLQSLAQAL